MHHDGGHEQRRGKRECLTPHRPDKEGGFGVTQRKKKKSPLHSFQESSAADQTLAGRRQVQQEEGSVFRGGTPRTSEPRLGSTAKYKIMQKMKAFSHTSTDTLVHTYTSSNAEEHTCARTRAQGERETKVQTKRQGERQAERQRLRDREGQRERQREIRRETKRATKRKIEKQKERERQREREKQRETEIQRETERQDRETER